MNIHNVSYIFLTLFLLDFVEDACSLGWTLGVDLKPVRRYWTSMTSLNCNWCVWPSCNPTIEGTPHFDAKTDADFISSLLTPLPEFFAKVIDDAVMNPNLKVILEVYLTLPTCKIIEINKSYNKIFNSDVTDEIKLKFEYIRDYSGGDHLGDRAIKFLRSLTEGLRKSNVNVDDKKVKNVVRKMQHEIIRDTGNWEKVFKIFRKSSIPQLKAIIKQYEVRNKERFVVSQTLEEDIKRTKEYDKKVVLLGILEIVRDQHTYFAEEIHKILTNKIVSDEDFKRLVYIIRSRCEIDLGDIKTAYQNKFGQSLCQPLSERSQFHFRVLAVLAACKK